MFSFQQTPDDLVFPFSISFQEQDHRAVKLHDHHVSMDASINNPLTKSRKLHQYHSPSSSKPNSATTDQDSRNHENTQRKQVHKEIERQRRRDMANLYASLRALLPLEFIKGKRSTSDHMQQAVNYIKHMQENIKALSVRRDHLKKLVDAGVTGSGTNSNKELESSMNLVTNTVSVSSCNGGVQILINSCNLIEDGFPLSRVLKAVSDEGYNVITCNCTKVSQRLIHSIQSEVMDDVSCDISRLQQRLHAVANNYTDEIDQDKCMWK